MDNLWLHQLPVLSSTETALVVDDHDEEAEAQENVQVQCDPGVSDVSESLFG